MLTIGIKVVQYLGIFFSKMEEAMAEGTCFKELENIFLGVEAPSRIARKKSGRQSRSIGLLNSKMDLLLEAVNGRTGFRNGAGRNEEELNSEHSRVSSGMHFSFYQVGFSKIQWEKSNCVDL